MIESCALGCILKDLAIEPKPNLGTTGLALQFTVNNKCFAAIYIYIYKREREREKKRESERGRETYIYICM